jgi:hypothetical protein
MALLFAAAACSMAIATPAPAQAVSTAASAYSNSAAAPPKMRHARRRFMQASIGHRRAAQDDLQPGQDDLQPTWDDFQQIERDNRDLDLPASQDDIIGAGGVHSREEDLARAFEQLGPWNGRQIRDICPSCGGAEDAPPVHQRRWPIHNGFNHQLSRNELRALHQQDVTRSQAQETTVRSAHVKQ